MFAKWPSPGIINSDVKLTKGTDLFSQLYIISIIVPDGDTNHVFPICFGLLKRKTKQCYNNFLTWIKYQYRNAMNFDENEVWLEPPGAICDFELSMIHAWETVFPNVDLGLCVVHKQVTLKKISPRNYF